MGILIMHQCVRFCGRKNRTFVAEIRCERTQVTGHVESVASTEYDAMHGRCQQTKTEKHETATCVPSSSLLLLLSHESTRALVQGTTARDEAADKQDQATRDRRVRALLFFCLCSQYHASTRALVCRKPPFVTKPPTSEAEIDPQETAV